MLRPLNQGHLWLKEVVNAGDSVIDATMGNGNDTLFLAQLKASVTAFDIQEMALEKTRARLELAGLSANLILDGHERIKDYVTGEIKGAIFNLGYLPSSDKTVITQAENTIAAIKQCLELLVCGGRIVIMIYYGHKGGAEEKTAVLAFLANLLQENFQVMRYQAINQKNNPPFLVGIEKLRD
ncbi:MAG: class I SAM-dependent methyltransferase [Streptococcaceae bacterium]|jgi:tRNA A58 N-methylase Trm61|nr:class I SAM-dependent methyltransferase [Streptococcaceae bacterium]